MILEERKWIQVVEDIEASADHQVNEALSSVLETEVKSQHRVNASEHSCKRKIAQISLRANKKIDKLQSDKVTLQNQCDQMKSVYGTDIATLKINHNSVIKEQQSKLQNVKIKYKSMIKEHQTQLQTAKIKYKSNVREQQRGHAEQIKKTQ